MAYHDEAGPDRVLFCTVGYARGPETRVYMDGSDAGLSRGEVVAALNGWVVDKETIAAEVRALRKDRERLDWLEGEMDREQQAIANHTPIPRSLFRRNEPVTRTLIDAEACEGGRDDG